MKFSYEQMQIYCSEMQATIKKMEENLDNIDEICTKLMNAGCWTGNGYQYYYNKLKGVTNNFREVYDDLEKSVLYLQQTAENYGSIDRKIIMNLANVLNFSDSK